MRNWHGNLSPFGTFHTGSASALAIYAVLGIRPGLVLDFDGSFFWSSGRKSFSDVITHAATTNATMVDSDGLLKWRPHNLLTYSEDFSNAAWTGTGGAQVSVTANAGTAPDGTSTADLLDFTAGQFADIKQAYASASVGEQYTFSVWLKLVSGNASLSLNDQSDGRVTAVEITSSWALYSADYLATSASIVPQIQDRNASGHGTVLVWGAHLYRSDLGGMVNNPDRGDSYVPTTSSAVYLSRRGHHVYNGTSWVNEGLLHESEARVNLFTYSGEFDNGAWTKLTSTISTGVGASPLGASSAAKLIGTVGSTNIRFQQAVSLTGGTTYTYSIFAKAAEYNTLRVQRQDTNLDPFTHEFDLTAGTTSGGLIQDFGDGWYRCSGSVVCNTSATTGPLFVAEPGATGDGTSGLLIDGAQLE